jgi:geranylgeranyl diphosphate synthase type II
MDDDDLRRGRPSLHRAFDEATALLAGNALLTFAFELLVRSYPGETGGCLVEELARGAGTEGMIGGQMADILSERGDGSPPCPVEEIHRRKTAALFAAAVRIGGVLGGCSRERVDLLGRYGRAIGSAFQIVDDLLEVEGASRTLGKPTQKERRNPRLTYPAVYGVERARLAARAHVEEACRALDELDSVTGTLRLRQIADYVMSRDR